MNILFLNDTCLNLERVFKGITNADTGEDWETPSWLGIATARDQRARIDGKCSKQGKQLVAGWFWDRYHVRLWKIGPNNVIAGAHHENLLTIGGNPFSVMPHKPDSFESGKVTICDDFRSLRTVRVRGVFLNNRISTPFADGWAAVITNP